MRSVTSRNVCGAFWGGFIGILATGAIHPILLPVGCLIGVVAGYWYQEIWAIVTAQWQQAQEWTRQQCGQFSKWFHQPSKIMAVLDVVGTWLAKVFDPFPDNPPARFLDLRRSPILRWITGHPMNRALIASISAITLFIVAIFVGTLHTLNRSPEAYLGAFWAVLVFGVMSCMLTYAASDTQNVSEKMRCFYRRFERYASYGWLGYMFYDLYAMLRNLLAILIMCLWMIVYGAGFGLLVLTGGVVPILAFFLSLRGIYEIVTRRAHWLCFAITLVTTSTTAWLAYPYLNGTLLWLAALANGCVCAGTVEAVRRLILAMFARFQQLAVLTTPGVMEARLLKVGRWYGRHLWDIDVVILRASLPV